MAQTPEGSSVDLDLNSPCSCVALGNYLTSLPCFPFPLPLPSYDYLYETGTQVSQAGFRLARAWMLLRMTLNIDLSPTYTS